MKKVCLVIMDGAGFETCISECGFLEGSVEIGIAQRWKMQTCLPTLSVPLYETIHTGLTPHEHGILSNESVRPSRCQNVFNILKDADKSSGVVAHRYFHTLYGGSAFDPFEHCEISDPQAPIPYARYYTMEGSRPENACLPSELDLCAQAWHLAHHHNPDYLLMHSPSADTLGHFYTSNSPEYRGQIWQIDDALARLIPRLQERGYDVLVSADHGINADGHHGGPQSAMREIALYYFGSQTGPERETVLDQRAIAPSILSLLGLAVPETMKIPSLF